MHNHVLPGQLTLLTSSSKDGLICLKRSAIKSAFERPTVECNAGSCLCM